MSLFDSPTGRPATSAAGAAPALRPPTAIESFLTNAEAGKEAVLEETSLGGTVKVVAGKLYVAASGRDCRRLRIQALALDARPQKRTACLKRDGWRVVPDITGN